MTPGDVPAAAHRPAIASSVAEELRRRVGAANAISAADLAGRVRARLGLEGLAASTIERRIREAVADLTGSCVLQIASCADGYYVPATDGERRAGHRSIVRAIGALVRRLRGYDRVTAERLQLALALDEPDRSDDP